MGERVYDGGTEIGVFCPICEVVMSEGGTKGDKLLVKHLREVHGREVKPLVLENRPEAEGV